VTDDFMSTVAEDKDWWTKSVAHRRARPSAPRARDLMRAIADATWIVARPRHASSTPLSTAGTRRRPRAASTPPTRAPSICSWTTSACNLASLNLMKFFNAGGQFRF